ncbi:MAG: C40 family peptidase [Bacteroidota bacterium]
MTRSRFRLILFFAALLLLVSRCNLLAPANLPPSSPTTDKPSEPIKGPVNEPTPEVRPPVEEPVKVRPSKRKEQSFREEITTYAKRFLGTEYLYAGRDPKKGFDCSGFTYYVMDKFDISLSPSSRAQEGQGKSVRLSNVQPGDLIFYRRSAGSTVFHVSLVVANEPDGVRVIHSTSRGVVIDNISKSSYWKPKISTARDVVSAKF